MISSVSSTLSAVSVLTAQSTGTSVGAAAEQEEKKKKSYVPSVEVSAAQSQAFSARVGDFLVNKSSQSSDSGSTVAGPTGPDGAAPAGAPPNGPPPGPPPGGADGGGAQGGGQGGGQGGAASALSLLSDNDNDTETAGESDASSASSSQTSSILSLLTGGESVGEAENDNDADDAAQSSGSKGPANGANTRYAQQQKASSGVFGVQFDDVGAYQFAASSY